MIDPRLLMQQPKPVDPKKREIAQMIMSGQPLQAPQATQPPPMFGAPMQLSPQQMQIFEQLGPADQMLFEDEYQRGVSPDELFQMFNGGMEPEGRAPGGNVVAGGPSFFDATGGMVPGQPDGVGTQVAPEPWQRRLNSLQYHIGDIKEQIEGGRDWPELKQQLQEYERERQQILQRYQPAGFQESRFNDAESYQVASDQPLAEDLKLTEGQSKDVNYFRRGLSAHQELSQPEMEKALLQWTDTIAGNFGTLGRKFQDAEFQQAQRAANEFLAMVLRKDTGAAVTAQEFELYGPIYLPMPGDKPEVIAAKRNAREQFLRGMEMGAGTAGPLIRQSREELRPSEMSDDDILRMLQGGN